MIRIRGGTVYDPANGVDGEVRDVWIDGGKIVEAPSASGDVEVIEAEGMLVLPGGVDMHTHVAGSKENAGRKLRPEDHREHLRGRSGSLRSGSGFTVPSTFLSGYLYAEMGYTTVMEAASAPLLARHAHEELDDLPMVDKGLLVTMGNNQFVMDCVARGEKEKLRHYVAWLLEATRSYAVKVVNPGGVENWKWGGNVASLDDPVIAFDGVTPRKILECLAEVSRDLGLPHDIHVHGLNLGQPRSSRTTAETLRGLDGRGSHLCHLQFLSYRGREEGHAFRSGAESVVEALRGVSDVTFDVGQVIFGPATTMTSDGPLEFSLHRMTGKKWVNDDVEAESGGGILPVLYDRKSRIAAEQWMTGLELFLLVDDPWKLALTTDHPNGGPFFCYPQVIRLLMDRDYRAEVLATLPPRAVEGALLPNLDREYSLYEIAIVTRAAPARILGLRDKGHLGVGADGDVALYDRVDVDGTECRCSRFASCRRALARVRHLVKGGRWVLREGKIVEEVRGRTFYVAPGHDRALERELRDYFERTYTVAFDNYALDDDDVPLGEVIPCERRAANASS
ncbi:formylmethanofuran dehydrogenase subunit A [Aminirod propionatiphilus]|uniref:Formylmethanofuran dehydrogenase subunit A n=1 Tax=Aminirod propionatiphilus TaxID=3415223 RepID=A0ACD1DTT3_9BACT|nr:formylmethanofuran dehydrogenase subunit A [Synergistota bacterium]